MKQPTFVSSSMTRIRMVAMEDYSKPRAVDLQWMLRAGCSPPPLVLAENTHRKATISAWRTRGKHDNVRPACLKQNTDQRRQRVKEPIWELQNFSIRPIRLFIVISAPPKPTCVKCSRCSDSSRWRP